MPIYRNVIADGFGARQRQSDSALSASQVEADQTAPGSSAVNPDAPVAKIVAADPQNPAAAIGQNPVDRAAFKRPWSDESVDRS
ncbi:hypothetical protein COO09_16875 [Rhizorhabdus dicambivorans]|uniref:Uncharacterized protein n=1 Tax=Rhizorhabdus dicambivorans TaxID=1850238 RepID=A0A2A4FRY2_9SPHN|nr:hypothetical protein CMV14_16185 [Rhizorhabdus dicambivorans]PCE41173.1 hypothetical protein COO09_16875 [Rhizorhabdus dicambivorans]